jgi:hypothetical protein
LIQCIYKKCFGVILVLNSLMILATFGLPIVFYGDNCENWLSS